MNPNRPLSGSQAWRKGSENLKVTQTRLLAVAMGGTAGKGHNSESAILQGFIFHSVVRPGVSVEPCRSHVLEPLERCQACFSRFLFHSSLMFRKIPPAADSPMPSPAAHITTPVPASVSQPFNNPSAVYLPSAPISSRLTSSYIMTSAMLSNAPFVASPDPSALMSHTTAFPHVAATLSIMDSTFKAPPAVSPIPAVIPSPSHKPSKTKTSKSSKVKDLSARSDESPSNKKRKPQPSTSSSSSLTLPTSLSSPLSGPHRKNCVLNASSALNSYQAAPPYNSLSVHNSNNGVSPLSAKLEPSGRTSLPGGPADIVRHVGSVGGSSDSCPLSVPSLAGDLSLASHNAVSSLPLSFDKSEGKKRKNSSSSSKACKITKMPGMNSVHKKNPPSLLAPVPDAVNSTSSRQVRDLCFRGPPSAAFVGSGGRSRPGSAPAEPGGSGQDQSGLCSEDGLVNTYLRRLSLCAGPFEALCKITSFKPRHPERLVHLLPLRYR